MEAKVIVPAIVCPGGQKDPKKEEAWTGYRERRDKAVPNAYKADPNVGGKGDNGKGKGKFGKGKETKGEFGKGDKGEKGKGTCFKFQTGECAFGDKCAMRTL